MTFTTADLYDAHSETVQVAEPIFRDYGGLRAFHGPIKTLKAFQDNSLVRKALEQDGQGRVLVVDGGGSMRCALLGDNLGALAIKNGWAGILVYGCVRDSRILATMELGVKALGTNPRRSAKKGGGEADLLVTFAGLTLHPGDHLYADEDGILLSTTPLHS